MTRTLLLAKISVCLAVFVFPNTLPACPVCLCGLCDIRTRTCMCMMSECVWHVQCMHVCVKSGECVMGINYKRRELSWDLHVHVCIPLNK